MAGTEASPQRSKVPPSLVSILEEVSLREEVALAGWDTLGAGTQSAMQHIPQSSPEEGS